MDKRKNRQAHRIVKHRPLIQEAATILCNIHLPNLLKGQIYQGQTKALCVPGLNCYSCPAATGACPIGALQSVAGSSRFSISYYVMGTLLLIGALMGRFVCGFLCPFGWFQELLHRIPGRKLRTERIKGLRFVKYIVLVVLVLVVPAIIRNEFGVGSPFFCKYLCPQGILEGALPLAAANSGIRSTLGLLFSWKLALLVAICLLSVFVFRPFCKWLCPLGACYALCNKASLLRIRVDSSACVSCGRCSEVCQMDVDVTRTPDHGECIRCGKCIRECPTDAISYCFGVREREKEMG